MTEIWKTAIYDGIIYEGLYKVSNLGRILSLGNGGTHKTSKILKTRKNKYGYLQVQLCKNGIRKTFQVHRLVAQTFIPNPENLPEVNHIDENKENNFVFLNEDGTVNKEKSNLEWSTHKNNCNHGTRIQRIAKTQSKPILQFTLDGKFVREWESIKECGRNGFNKSHVCQCCKGKLKTHKGFRWEYK